MNAQEINHAAGLVKSLRAKAALLRQQADDLDHDKEGRSRYADRLREQADEAKAKAYIDEINGPDTEDPMWDWSALYLTEGDTE